MRHLRAVAVIGAALLAAACSNSVGSVPAPEPTLAPMASIQHVIVMVQENRSFDNLFMSYPGADTVTSGACTPNKYCPNGKPIPLKPVLLEANGLPGGKDLDHTHKAFETEFAGGKMNGFNLIHEGATGLGKPLGRYPYAYVVRSEIRPYWDLARQYTLADHMFSTDTASSFIAHQEIIAGTVRISANASLTDEPNYGAQPWGCDAPRGTTTPLLLRNGTEKKNGPFPCFDEYKTLADLLDVADTSWKYYVASISDTDEQSGQVWNGFDAIQKVACTNFTGEKVACHRGKDWQHISSPNTTIFTDIRNGKLPKVSWLIPTLNDSDHPASGCNHGPAWVTSVVDAVGKSRYWKSTAIVIIWDDWGGWYDNVAPPQISYTSLGMRVPMLVVSPYARHGYVSHTQYDFGSILKYIEGNFALGSLGTSDATANSIADSFDFTQTPKAFKPIVAASPKPCASSSSSTIIERDGGVPE